MQTSLLLTFSLEVLECCNPFSRMAPTRALDPSLTYPSQGFSRLSFNLKPLGHPNKKPFVGLLKHQPPLTWIAWVVERPITHRPPLN